LNNTNGDIKRENDKSLITALLRTIVCNDLSGNKTEMIQSSLILGLFKCVLGAIPNTLKNISISNWL